MDTTFEAEALKLARRTSAARSTAETAARDMAWPPGGARQAADLLVLEPGL